VLLVIPFSAVASAAVASSGLTKLAIQTIVAQASKTMRTRWPATLPDRSISACLRHQRPDQPPANQRRRLRAMVPLAAA